MNKVDIKYMIMKLR